MDKNFKDFENLVEERVFYDDARQLFDIVQKSYTDRDFSPERFAVAINLKFKMNLLEVLNAYHCWIFDNPDRTS